jgi:hypothetical protein
MAKKMKIVPLLVFIFVAYTRRLYSQSPEQQRFHMLREIGNDFLLQLNDSTSRILPVKKEGERYSVEFDRQFSMEPDLVIYSVIKILEKYIVEESYLLEIEQCSNGEVVHSYLAKTKILNDEFACKQRTLPWDCYIFYFTLIEGSTLSDMENSAREFSKWYLAILVLLAIALLFLTKKKISQIQKPLKIGKYKFDSRAMTLSFKGEEVELSAKESDLLILLLENQNKTVKRETILNKIWNDEGNYVGRTLDVYISKLRKKLEADESIKISNIRGVGYKLFIQ